MYKIRTTKKKRRTNFSDILKAHRLSQTELSDICEVQKYIISNLCTGKQTDAKISTLKKICNGLNWYIQTKQKETIYKILIEEGITNYDVLIMSNSAIKNIPQKVWDEYEIEEDYYFRLKDEVETLTKILDEPYTLHNVFGD